MRVAYTPVGDEANKAVAQYTKAIEECNSRRDEYLVSVGGSGYICDSAGLTIHGVLFENKPQNGYVRGVALGGLGAVDDYYPDPGSRGGREALMKLKSLSLPLFPRGFGVKPAHFSIESGHVYFAGAEKTIDDRAIMLAHPDSLSIGAPFERSPVNAVSDMTGAGHVDYQQKRKNKPR